MSQYVKPSLKKEMMDQIQQFIDDYPEHGYRSLAQFIEDAVRRRAEDLHVSELTPRFEHINTFEDHISLKDNKFPNREFDIYPNTEQGKLWCENDDSTDCIHVQAILDKFPRIAESLREKGLKLS